MTKIWYFSLDIDARGTQQLIFRSTCRRVGWQWKIQIDSITLDNGKKKAAPRLCSIVKHFYHFLCSEIVVYFFFCPFVWSLGVWIWLETNNNVQSVSVSSVEHLFSIRVAFDRPYKMKLRRMNGVIMVNIAFVSFDKLRLSDMAIETSLCITKNESGTYLSQCQASTVLIIIFIRFIFTFWSEKETKIYRKIDMLAQCGTEHIAF